MSEKPTITSDSGGGAGSYTLKRIYVCERVDIHAQKKALPQVLHTFRDIVAYLITVIERFTEEYTDTGLTDFLEEKLGIDIPDILEYVMARTPSGFIWNFLFNTIGGEEE